MEYTNYTTHPYDYTDDATSVVIWHHSQEQTGCPAIVNAILSIMQDNRPWVYLSAWCSQAFPSISPDSRPFGSWVFTQTLSYLRPILLYCYPLSWLCTWSATDCSFWPILLGFIVIHMPYATFPFSCSGVYPLYHILKSDSVVMSTDFCLHFALLILYIFVQEILLQVIILYEGYAHI